ncbi:MAG: hypothetical protein ABI210_07915 [Abditibacteriaceae bacterium]
MPNPRGKNIFGQIMKIFKTGLALLAVTSFLSAHGVFASPAKGTSAEAAAILKNHPPAGWISHYLGDDRYKIAGHVWRVVSTQGDTYFHRPDCPEILRQPPGIVIGFASVSDALEAGYLPDPHCNPTDSNTPISIGGTISKRTQRIRLSDGSTITLPAGWRKMQSQKINSKFISATIDSFAPGKSLGSGASIITMRFPSGKSETLTAAKAKEYMSLYNQSGYVNSAIPSRRDDMNVRDTTYKGMKGVIMTPKKKDKGDGIFYMVQKGSRLYIVAVGGNKGIPAGAKTIINSYQPR